MIKAKAIIEIAGFPKEHVEKTMNAVISGLANKKEFSLKEKEIMPAEQKGEMFSAVAEATIDFKEISDIYGFCFDAMPSSIDIISPEEMMIDSRTLNAGLNDLLATLHSHDMYLKNSNARYKILSKNLGTLLSNFILHLLEKEATKEELSKELGIPEENLKTFLEELEKQKLITRNGEKYKKT
jgi:hypothetical protein